MKCKNCNNIIEEGLEKCPHCGVLLHEEKSQQEAKREVTPEEKLARGIVGVETAAIAGAVYASKSNAKDKSTNSTGTTYNTNGNQSSNYDSNGVNNQTSQTGNTNNENNITSESPIYMSDPSGYSDANYDADGSSYESYFGADGHVNDYLDFNTTYNPAESENYQIVNDFLEGDGTSFINDYLEESGMSIEDLLTLLNGESGTDLQDSVRKAVEDYVRGLVESGQLGDVSEDDINAIVEAILNGDTTYQSSIPVLDRNAIEAELSKILSEKFSEVLKTKVKVDFKLTEEVLDLSEIKIEERDGKKVYIDKDGKVFESLEALIVEHTELIDYEKVLELQSDYKPPEEPENYGGYTGGRIDINPFYLGSAIVALGGPKIIGKGSDSDSGWDYLTKKTNALKKAFRAIPKGNNTNDFSAVRKYPNATSTSTKEPHKYRSVPKSARGFSDLCNNIMGGSGCFSGEGDSALSDFMEDLYEQLASLQKKISDNDDDIKKIFNCDDYGSLEDQLAAYNYSYNLTAGSYVNGFGDVYGQSHETIAGWIQDYDSLAANDKKAAFRTLQKICKSEFSDEETRKQFLTGEFEEDWREKHGNLNLSEKKYEEELAKYIEEREKKYAKNHDKYLEDQKKYFESRKSYYESIEAQNDSFRVYHEKSAVVDFGKDIFLSKNELATICTEIAGIEAQLESDDLSDEERSKLNEDLRRKEYERKRLELIVSWNTDDLTQEEREQCMREYAAVCSYLGMTDSSLQGEGLTRNQLRLYGEYSGAIMDDMRLQDFVDNYDSYIVTFDDRNLTDYQKDALDHYDEYAGRLGELSDAEMEAYNEAKRILEAKDYLARAREVRIVQNFVNNYDELINSFNGHTLHQEYGNDAYDLFAQAKAIHDAQEQYDEYLKLSKKVSNETSNVEERKRWKQLQDDLDTIITNSNNSLLTEPYEQILYYYFTASNAAERYMASLEEYNNLNLQLPAAESAARLAGDNVSFYYCGSENGEAWNPAMTYQETVDEASRLDREAQFLRDSITAANNEMLYDLYLLNCARQGVIALDIRQNLGLYDDFYAQLDANLDYNQLQIEKLNYMADYYDRMYNQAMSRLKGISDEIDDISSGFVFPVNAFGDMCPYEVYEEYYAECDRIQSELDKAIAPSQKLYADQEKYAEILGGLAGAYEAEREKTYLSMPDVDQYRQSSIVASYELVENRAGGYYGGNSSVYSYSYVFYDADGNIITDKDEIACYCVQNGIEEKEHKWYQTPVYGYPTEEVEKLRAIQEGRKYNPNDFSSEDAYLAYYYAKDKYGIELAKERFDYYFDLGAQIIGKEEADARIERLKKSCFSTDRSNPLYWGDIKALGWLMARSLGDGLEGWVDNMDNLFNADGRKSAHEYRNEQYIKLLASEDVLKDKCFENIYEIGSSIGNMIPSIAANVLLSVITGGASLSETAMEIVRFAVTFSTMGLSAWGGAKENALQMGMDELSANFYGLFSGLSETTLEMVLGSLPGIGHMKKVFEGSEYAFVRFFGNMLSEGIEESTQEIFDTILLAAFTGEQTEIDWDAVLKAGIYGAITSGIMSISGGIINTGKYGIILGNEVLKAKKTGNTIVIDYLTTKYEGQNLSAGLMNLEFIRDLNNLTKNDPTQMFNKLKAENLEDPEIARRFDAAKDKDSSLTFDEFVKKVTLNQMVKLPTNVDVVSSIVERSEKLSELESKIKEFRDLQANLGLTLSQAQDVLSVSKNNDIGPEAQLVGKHAELIKLQNEVNEVNQKIYEAYKQAKEKMLKLQSDLDSKESDMSIEDYYKALGEIEGLKSQVDSYEKYLMNSLNVDNYIHTADTIRNEILYDENSIIQKATTLDETEKMLEQTKTELEELLRENNDENLDRINELRNKTEGLEALRDKLQRQLKNIDTRLQEHLDLQDVIVNNKVLDLAEQNRLLNEQLNEDSDLLDQLQDIVKELVKGLGDEEDFDKLKSIETEIEEKRNQIGLLQKEQITIQEQINKNNAELERITNGKIVGIDSETGPVGKERAQLLRAAGENVALVGLLPNLRQMVANTDMQTNRTAPSNSGSSYTAQVGHITVDSSGVVHTNFGTQIADNVETRNVSDMGVLPVREQVNLPRVINNNTVENFLDIEDNETCAKFLKNKDVKNVIINQFSDESFRKFVNQDYTGDKVRSLFDAEGIDMLNGSEELSSRLKILFENPRIRSILLADSNFTEMLVENIDNIGEVLPNLDVNSLADRAFLDELSLNINDGKINAEDALSKLNSQEQAYVKERLANIDELKVESENIDNKTEKIADGVKSYISELSDLLSSQDETDISEKVKSLVKSLATELAHNKFDVEQYNELIAKLAAVSEMIDSKLSESDSKNKELFTQTAKNIKSLLSNLETKLNEATVNESVDTTNNRVLEKDLAEKRFKDSLDGIEGEVDNVTAPVSDANTNHVIDNPFEGVQGEVYAILSSINSMGLGIDMDLSSLNSNGKFDFNALEKILEQNRIQLINNLNSFDEKTAEAILSLLGNYSFDYSGSYISPETAMRFSKNKTFVELVSANKVLEGLFMVPDSKFIECFDENLLDVFRSEFHNDSSTARALVMGLNNVESLSFLYSNLYYGSDRTKFMSLLTSSMLTKIINSTNVDMKLVAASLIQSLKFPQLSNAINDYITNLDDRKTVQLYASFLESFYKSSISSFIGNLSIDAAMKIKDSVGPIIYTFMSNAQLSMLYKGGNTECFNYLQNYQRIILNYNGVVKSPESFFQEPRNHIDVQYTDTRSDGSKVSHALKNIIKTKNGNVYVYLVNGIQYYSDSFISYGSDEFDDFVKNELLSETNLELARQNGGYLGTVVVDGKNSFTVDRTNMDNITKAIDSYVNNFETFMDDAREGDPNLRFGSDQNIKYINRERLLVDRFGLVDIIDSGSYGRITEYFKNKYNMSEETVKSAILYVINSPGGGICSYANIANMIFYKFQNNSYAFKKTFGFDMYDFENGKKALNYRMLIMDMFVRANSTDIGITAQNESPKIFSVDPNTNERVINTEVDEYGIPKLVTSADQIHMSGGGFARTHAIKYLNDYGINVDVNTLNYTNNSATGMDIDRLKSDIKSRLLRGEVVCIGEYYESEEVVENGKKVRKAKPGQVDLIFHNLDGSEDTHIKEWNEGGGHITTIVGIDEDGLIVVSWGNKHKIQFSDLRNYNCSFFSLNLSSNMITDSVSDQKIVDIFGMESLLQNPDAIANFDLDYAIKNYLSTAELDSLVKSTNLEKLLSVLKTPSSIEMVLESVKNNVSETAYYELLNKLTTEQRLYVFNSKTVSPSLKIDLISKVTEKAELVRIMKMVDGTMNPKALASLLKSLSVDQITDLLSSNDIDIDIKNRILRNTKTSPNGLAEYFKRSDIRVLVDYASEYYANNPKEFESFIKALSFDQLAEVVLGSKVGQSSVVLDTLINSCDNPPALNYLLFNFLQGQKLANVIEYFKSKTDAEMQSIRSKFNKEGNDLITKSLEGNTQDALLNLDDTINPATLKNDNLNSTPEVNKESAPEIVVIPDDTNGDIDLSESTLKLFPEDNIDRRSTPVNVNEDLVQRTTEVVQSLKERILSKITPEMSELEKARLIYLELGNKLDYDPLYRYALRTKNAELYNEIYNGTYTMSDVEQSKSIICATWAQIYSEMLEAAGFSRDSIVIQRLTVDPNVEGNNYVYNSHAAIYVTLSNGDLIIPDMTVPFTGAADFYNIKAGKGTTGFIYVTKEQMHQISEDWKNYPNNDIEYYSNIVTSQNLDEDVKNFIEAAGSYFYGHVFSDETLAKLKEQHSNMFANRRAQQNAFFNYLREKNTNVIKVADNNIASLITPSDFFYKTITEEGLKFQAENDVHILEDAVELLLFEEKSLFNAMLLRDTVTTALFGLDNVKNRNLGTILSYLRETATNEGIHYAAGKSGLSVKFLLNTRTENNSITMQFYVDGKNAGSSFEISVDNDGNLKITNTVFNDSVSCSDATIREMYIAYENGIISQERFEQELKSAFLREFNIHDGYSLADNHKYDKLSDEFNAKFHSLVVEYMSLMAESSKYNFNINVEEYFDYTEKVNNIKNQILDLVEDAKIEQIKTEDELPKIFNDCHIDSSRISEATMQKIKELYETYRNAKYEYFKHPNDETRKAFENARRSLNRILNRNSRDTILVGLMPASEAFENLDILSQRELLDLLQETDPYETTGVIDIIKRLTDPNDIETTLLRIYDPVVYNDSLKACNLPYSEKIRIGLEHYSIDSIDVNGKTINRSELIEILSPDNIANNNYTKQELLEIYLKISERFIDRGYSNYIKNLCYENIREMLYDITSRRSINNIDIPDLLLLTENDLWKNPKLMFDKIYELSNGNIQYFVEAEKQLIEVLEANNINLDISEDLKYFVYGFDGVEYQNANYQAIYGRNKGIDQGSIRAAMNSSDRKIRNKLIKKVKQKYPGISTKQAIVFLNSIEGHLKNIKTQGVCNFADVSDGIVEFFMNNQDIKFRDYYDFDLFDSKTGDLNAAELLLDVYMSINGDEFISKNPNAIFFSKYLSKESNMDYIHLTEAFGEDNFYKTLIIENYLKSKGLNVNITQGRVAFLPHDSRFKIDVNNSSIYSGYILGKINNLLAQNKHVSLTYIGAIRMQPISGGKANLYTGCHIMTVIGTMGNQIIVNTYNGNFLIDLESIITKKPGIEIAYFDMKISDSKSTGMNDALPPIIDVASPVENSNKQVPNSKKGKAPFIPNLTPEQLKAKAIKSIARDIASKYFSLFGDNITKDDVTFDVIRSFQDSVDLLSLDSKQFDLLKKLDSSVFDMIRTIESNKSLRNFDKGFISKTIEKYLSNPSIDFKATLYNDMIQSMVEKIKSSGFTDAEKATVIKFINDYYATYSNDTNTTNANINYLYNMLAKNTGEAITLSITKDVNTRKYPALFNSEQFASYENGHTVLYELRSIDIGEYKARFNTNEFAECKTFDDFYEAIVKNNKLDELQKFYDEYRVKKIAEILKFGNLPKGIENRVKPRQNPRVFEEDVLAAYLIGDENLTVEEKDTVLRFIRKLRLNSTNTSEIIRNILVIKTRNSLVSVIDKINEEIDKLKIDAIEKGSSDILLYYDQSTRDSFVKDLVSKYSNNHLVSKYLVFEEMLSDPMLDIDTKNKLTRQYLKGVFGGLSESLNIEEIMNQPSRNMVNAAISELVNKGISSEEIMKAMAQNLGEYYKKYGITINEELMKHIFTFDASRGQNGGFHYNTALANIKLERIGDGKFKLYTEDENGNKLYFKDTTGLEETEIVKSLWDDNTYSIVDIIDMAVNAYYSLRINETEIRGNGNYAYEFTLPNGEKSRAIFDGNGVLITVF